MKRISLWALTALLPLFLLTPAQAFTNMQAGPADVGSYDAIHRVAVLSAIGPALHLKVVHLMVPTEKAIDISAWHLDDQVNASIRKYLASRFSFSDVPFDAARLADIYPNWMGSGAMDNFLATVPNQGVDAFIVVRAPGAMMVMSGYSMDETVLWMNFVVEVYDAHTRERISKTFARMQFSHPAYIRFSDSLAFDDNFALGPDRLDAFRKFIEPTVQDEVLEAIRSLKFGVPLPPMRDSIVPALPAPAAAPTVKTLAVASLLGDRLDLYDENSFMTPLRRNEYPQTGWNVDADVASTIHGALGAGYQVQDVAPGALAGARLVFQDGGASVTGLTARDDVDAYLLVLKLGSDAEWKNANRIWRFSNVTGTFNYIASSYAVVLVDAHTLKVLAGHVGTFRSDETSDFPAYDLNDDGVLTPAGDSILPDDVEDVQRALKKLLAKSVPQTLDAMGFTLDPKVKKRLLW